MKRGVLRTYRRAFILGLLSLSQAREWRERLNQAVAHRMDLDGSIFDSKRGSKRILTYDTAEPYHIPITPTSIPPSLPTLAEGAPVPVLPSIHVIFIDVTIGGA